MTIKVCPVCAVSWYADKPEKHMMTCTAKELPVTDCGGQAMTDLEELERIDQRHKLGQRGWSGHFEQDYKVMCELHQDRATLLRILKSRTAPLVDCEALVKWYLWKYGATLVQTAAEHADALIASGILHPMPTRDAIRKVLELIVNSNATADAIIALINTQPGAR